MTRDYVFGGHQATTYPQFQHPEQDGVLTAEPGEILTFDQTSPPADGHWYDVSSGDPWLGQATAEEAEAGPDDGGGQDKED